MESLLVFVHLPKAAGSTFGNILRHHYPGPAFDGGINVFQRFELAAPRLEAAAARTDLGAISAEVTFELADRYLPAGTSRYVTILREPVERALSQFWFFKASRGAGLIPPWLPPPPAGLTLEQAVADGYIIDNLQTRMLCLVSPFDPLPADALERGKRNLAERFAYVGTTARFDEFLALLNLELGWPTLPYRRTQVNRRNSGRRTLSPEEIRLVEEANVLDSALFAYADHLFGLALAAAGPELEAEVEVLRRALPLERRARKGLAPSAGSVRSLPLEARVALALKEAELGRTRDRLRAKTRTAERLKRKALRRDERIAELKRALES